MNLSLSGSLVVGSEFSLTCAAFKKFPGLSGYSAVKWTIRDYYDSALQVLSLLTPDQENTSILQFNPLKSSHSREYTCQASYFSPTGNISHSIKNASVIPQSKD